MAIHPARLALSAALVLIAGCGAPPPTLTPAEGIQFTAEAVHKLACLGQVVDAMARVDPTLARQLRNAVVSGRPLTAAESALVLSFCDRLGTAAACLAK